MIYLRAFILMLLLAFSISGFAAGSKVDSVEKLLKKPNLTLLDSLRLLNELGFELWTVDPSRSVEVGRKALTLAHVLSDTSQTAYSYKVIGVAYWALGDYQLALSNMLQSLQLYEELKDKYGIGSMLLNIGLIYSDQRSNKEAKEYFRKAYAAYEKNNRKVSQATALTKLATVLSLEDSLALAKQHLNTAIEVHHENDYRYGLAEAYNRLGIVYRKEQDFNASLDYLYRSRDISYQIDDNEGLAKCFVDIGLTFLEMKKFEEAEDYLTKGIDKAESIGSKKWQMEGFLGMATLFNEKAETSLALKYYRSYQLMKDSILDQQKIMAMANLREEYETRQQVKELEDSKFRIRDLQEKARSRTIFLISLAILFVLSIVVIALYYRNQNLKSKQREEQREKEIQLREIREQKHKAEVENIRLKQKELERELELRDRELASYALNFLQKNEFISEVKADLQKVKSISDLERVKRKLKVSSQLDRDWENFKMQFEKVHGSFSDELKTAYPELSPAELKLATLLRINLSTKECASILGIGVESTKTARYRLRKKMDLGTEENLFDHLSKFGS